MTEQLQWAHGYFENGAGALITAGKTDAIRLQRERGGFVVVRPKPDKWEVVTDD